MISQNQQCLIGQELIKIMCDINTPYIDVTGYELDGQYKIAISSKAGMIPEICIARILRLRREYDFNFYISDTCYISKESGVFIIIY